MFGLSKIFKPLIKFCSDNNIKCHVIDKKEKFNK